VEQIITWIVMSALGHGLSISDPSATVLITRNWYLVDCQGDFQELIFNSKSHNSELQLTICIFLKIWIKRDCWQLHLYW